MTKLIVKNYHERGNHATGVNFILCKLSERFWIIAAREEIRKWDHECNECKRRRSKSACQIMSIAAREEIRKWDHECNECKRRRSKSACQIMSPLPKMRLRFSFRSFAQTALDFAGLCTLFKDEMFI